MTEALYGGIEAGGTKFVCVVGTGPTDIRARERYDTTTPDETIGRCVDFFRRYDGLAALGIASFGPLELRPEHPDYGCITTTPKPGWSRAPLLAPFAEHLGVPIAVDTDVNGAVLAEARWGAARGLDNALYLTVGTGIGGGAMIGGATVRGLIHPEMGHVSVDRLPDDDFGGICPFHGDCLEGLGSGPAIEARWGVRAVDLPPSRAAEALEIEAFTVASGLRQFVYVLAPQRIVIGGGVSKMSGFHAAVGASLLDQLAGYGVQPEHRAGFVVPPGLGDDSGAAGALALARRALD